MSPVRRKSSHVFPVLYEMAEHYNTAIIPARVRTPKDKANAESAVGIISTWITAALRNEQFFSLVELNRAIRKKLEIFSHRPFQKKEGSRYEIFRDEELPLLAKLPATPYELAEWKSATVQFNYHISVNGMLYSVPYEFIKRKVEVRITDKVVEIFYNHNRIASHRRLYGRKGQYSTVTEHMPPDHQMFLEWNGDRFRKWAERIGTNTYNVVNAILSSQRLEQQSYRSCMGILKYLIRNAGFDQPEAYIADINYNSGRKLNRNLIERLATCEYITEYRNIFITGATGSGKTCMACAFGMEACSMEACKQRYKTKYVRLPDLLLELDMARSEGNYKKVLAKYARPVLLIIDEWLLLKPTESEQHDILELLHQRRKKSSTIFCSQYEPAG